MNKQQILNYIRFTPNNTNVNVLNGMIDTLIAEAEESGSGGSDNNLILVDVTVNMTQFDFKNIYIPHYDETNKLLSTLSIIGPGEYKLKVPIDNTKGLVGIHSDFSLQAMMAMTLSGGIAISADTFEITGPGTITI